MWMMRGPLSEPAKEDMLSVAHSTAAARRRQRRFRQFLRHDWLTSRWSWPRGTTTQPHGDRSRPGAVRRYELHDTATIWKNLTSSPTGALRAVFRRRAQGVPGQPVWVSRGSHRKGSSSAPWTRSPTSCPWSRFWTFLCRSWWLRSSTSTSRFPSRLSKCPGSRRHPVVLACVVLAWCSWSRRRRSSWWRCRLLPCCSSGLPSRTLTFQFRVVVGWVVEVFQGFRPGQNSTASNAEQIVHIPVRSRGLQGFRSRQFSAASSSSLGAADEAFQGERGVSHFSPISGKYGRSPARWSTPAHGRRRLMRATSS